MILLTFLLVVCRDSTHLLVLFFKIFLHFVNAPEFHLSWLVGGYLSQAAFRIGPGNFICLVRAVSVQPLFVLLLFFYHQRVFEFFCSNGGEQSTFHLASYQSIGVAEDLVKSLNSGALLCCLIVGLFIRWRASFRENWYFSSAWIEAAEGGEKVANRPSLQELRRGIVNFNETEHLQCRWMWLMGWALTSHTVTSFLPPGPCSEWNGSQIKPQAHDLMVCSFQIPLNAVCLLPKMYHVFATQMLRQVNWNRATNLQK